MLALATNEQVLLTLDPVATATRPRRHGSPRGGVSLATATEIREKPVREAVMILASGLFPEKLEEVCFETFPARLELKRNLDSLPVRATWNLVLICLTARSSDQYLPRCGEREC